MRVAALPDFGGPEAFALEEVPIPVPGARDVLIEVVAAGVNRADILQREGKYPAPPDAPAWPGLEVSGTVAAVGDDVDRWVPGDSVCALLAGGGYGEWVAVDEDLVLPAPPGIVLADAGGLVEAACTVWSNLRAANASAGQLLLVHGGSGGIGTLAIQVGKALGMTVATTAGGPERARRCLDIGADVAIDYRAEDFAAEIGALGGADVILDVVGAAYLDRNLAALADDGALVVIGLQRGARAEIDLRTLMSRRARVLGTTLRGRPHAQKAQIVADVEREVWPWVGDTVSPIVHATYPLERVADAHRALESGDVFGKVLLTTDASS